MSVVGERLGSPASPGTLVSLVALYRLLLRTQITLARLLGIGALGALSILLGVFSRLDDNPAQAAADAVSGYGLGILVPLATLWLGTSVIGDLVEDKLLVYLSLKPVPRWQLPAAAIAATVSIVVPLTALPLAASALVAGPAESPGQRCSPLCSPTLAYRRPLRRGGPLVSAGGLVGARLRPDLGERRGLLGERCGALHGARLGVLRLGLAPGIDVQLESAPRAPPSSCSRRSRSWPGWPRPGGTAARTSTRAGAARAR